MGYGYMMYYLVNHGEHLYGYIMLLLYIYIYGRNILAHEYHYYDVITMAIRVILFGQMLVNIPAPWSML